jgi:hypothetical protein
MGDRVKGCSYLDIEIQRELPGMGTKPDGIDLSLALVL